MEEAVTSLFLFGCCSVREGRVLYRMVRIRECYMKTFSKSTFLQTYLVYKKINQFLLFFFKNKIQKKLMQFFHFFSFLTYIFWNNSNTCNLSTQVGKTQQLQAISPFFLASLKEAKKEKQKKFVFHKQLVPFCKHYSEISLTNHNTYQKCLMKDYEYIF